jgi:hypothetical protein
VTDEMLREQVRDRYAVSTHYGADTHQVADGMRGAIVKATKRAD